MNNLHIKEGEHVAIAKLEAFDRKKEKFQKFRRQYMLYLLANPKITSNEAKIMTALSWMMEGTDDDWAENYVEQAMEQKQWGTFEQFEENLATSFTDQDEQKKALVKLECLRLGSLSAKQYYLQVDQSIQKARCIMDAQIISILERSLNSALIDKMYRLEEVLATYLKWKVHSTNYDNVLRRRKELGCPVETKRLILATMPWREHQGEPMDIDARRKRLEGVKCYACGGMGHLAWNCQGQKEVWGLEGKENSKEDFPEGNL
jgi:hypothetical protein